ncbi:MAG: hypothetical protein IKI93_02210 [Clostridia bacterium]|nr:hypothetical protein [Clostridia bacterium]
MYCKENELNVLTAEEFAILQQKLKYTLSQPCTGNLEFHQFESGRTAAELPDKELGLYRRVAASSPFLLNTMYEYSKVFTFCVSLGIQNIFDIGCGNQMQGLMLMYAPEMTYTGIDPHLFHDPFTDFDADVGDINDRLAQFQNWQYDSDRIFYIEKSYPCELEIERNNIAVMLHMEMEIEKDSQAFRKLTEALSKNFERIFKNLTQTELDVKLIKSTPVRDIVSGKVDVQKDVFAERLSEWRRAMPEFTFFTLGNGYIFGTKNERDIKKIQANYTVSKKNEITAGYMDAPFHRKMARVRISGVNRNLHSSTNKYISMYCRQNELDALTDEEFVTLQHKMSPYVSHPDTGNMEFRDFCIGKPADKIFRDSREFGIYKRMLTCVDDYFDSRDRYSKIFSLCAALGINNIYDIGCGQQMQGLMMMYAPEMTYTGIDMEIFHDWATQFDAAPGYINDRLAQFQSGQYSKDQIFYIKQSYPCELTVERNNVAVMLGCFLGIEEDQRAMNAMTEALSRDFERIVKEIPLKAMDVKLIKNTPARDIASGKVDIMTDIFADRFAMWKRAMPGFEFFHLGNGFIFGTKNERDIKKLQANYTVSKRNEITAGLMDRAFYKNMMK